MSDTANSKLDVFSINEKNFESFAIGLFRKQWEHNKVYHNYCKLLGKGPANVGSIQEIPFLPIELFKHHEIITGTWKPQSVFLSSGTTDTGKSRHLVKDESFYHQVAQTIFERTYGNLEEYEILALLPSYLEQEHSSLVSMVDHFLKKAGGGDFFLHNYGELTGRLKAGIHRKKLLIGVSYALLDLAEQFSFPLEHTIVMETGGMKGRRKEITREELHLTLKRAFGVSEIHSEYGMTELSSQAYARNGLFKPADWCRILIRDINDPFHWLEPGQTGGINVIDLANFDTCAFIETKDLGKVHKKVFFEVLGRYDNSDLRGCNLMA